jgi:hypothetical protein
VALLPIQKFKMEEIEQQITLLTNQIQDVRSDIMYCKKSLETGLSHRDLDIPSFDPSVKKISEHSYSINDILFVPFVCLMGLWWIG